MFTKLEMCVREYWSRLKDRSITVPAYILVYYAIPVGMCVELGFNITSTLVEDPEQASCWAPIPGTKTRNTLIVALIQTLLYFVLYPFLGWLTDTLLDRGKAMKASLLLCWIGSFLQVVSYCIQYGTCGLPTSIAKYGISLVALLCLTIGAAGYQTNILGYGQHQLFDPASFKPFIHWMVWGQYVGFLVSYIVFMQNTIHQAKVLLITGILVCFTCSVAVIIDQFFYYKFEPAFEGNYTSYKLVFEVMKYAREHKTPENYDAIPSLEDRVPRRISLAKLKYGGPFKEEEVEKVKMFWRITALFAAMFGFYIPHYLFVNGPPPFVNVFSDVLRDINGYGSYILWNSFDKAVLVFIPVLELVIFPLFPRLSEFLSNSLKGFGVAYIFLFMSLLSMLVIDTVGHYVTTGNSFCFLTSAGATINISYYYYTLPLLFGSLANVFGLIFVLEFVYSHAPINMSGMLTGTFYLVRGIYTGAGPYLQLPFMYSASTGPGRLSCTFWIILINLILCFGGLIVYTLTCVQYRKWEQEYKKNEEEYFSREYSDIDDSSLPRHNSVN